MESVIKFAKSPLGTVVLTLIAVYLAEKSLMTNLAGVPAAIKAKVSK